jgi:hypothetical protein
MPQQPTLIKNIVPANTAGNYANFNANTAGTQVKTGVGTLLGINVNTAGTGGNNVMMLYDGTSTAGAVLGIPHYASSDFQSSTRHVRYWVVRGSYWNLNVWQHHSRLLIKQPNYAYPKNESRRYLHHRGD